MTTIDSETAESMRQAFKVFNRFMLLMWRLGLGFWVNIWPKVIGRIMVLTHTGRKSGRTYRTPVNFALMGGELYCTAGYGRKADWYRNIAANPEVEVWLPDGWWVGVAEDVNESEERPAIMREVLIASGFAARAVGIDPFTMSDAEIERLTADYRVIHIRRTAARTGPGGPGELAWIWPLATVLLLPLALRRRRRTE